MNIFLRAALAVFVGAVLSGCNSSPSDSEPETSAATTAAPETVQLPKDDLGREVPLREPARRAIVLGPGAVEMVYALGEQDRLVARDDASDFPPAAKEVKVAGNFQGPSVETAVALAPDLIIMQGETWDKTRVERWEKQIGAPIAVIGAATVEGVGGDIEQLGAWLGASKKAQEVAASFKKSENTNAKAPSAFIELGRSPLFTAGAGTLVGDAVERAGFSNAAKVKGYQAYNLENLLANEPDFYVLPSDKPREQELKALRAHPALSKLRAVKEGRVIVVNPGLLLRPGPRLKDGIEALQSARTVGRGQLNANPSAARSGVRNERRL